MEIWGMDPERADAMMKEASRAMSVLGLWKASVWLSQKMARETAAGLAGREDVAEVLGDACSGSGLLLVLKIRDEFCPGRFEYEQMRCSMEKAGWGAEAWGIVREFFVKGGRLAPSAGAGQEQAAADVFMQIGGAGMWAELEKLYLKAAPPSAPAAAPKRGL